MLYIYKILVVNWLVVLKICEDLITLYTGFIDLTIRPRASMLFKVAFPPPNNTYHSHLYRPSRTFKLRFGGVSSSFVLAMAILAQLLLARMQSMARPNSLGMRYGAEEYQKSTIRYWLFNYSTSIPVYHIIKSSTRDI